MTIYIIDKGKTCLVTLRQWEDGIGWSPDCFAELETNIPLDYPANDYDTDASAAMTYAEYIAAMEWWQAEVDAYNLRLENSWFVEGLSSDEIAEEYAKGREWTLDYETLDDGGKSRFFLVDEVNNGDLWTETLDTMDRDEAVRKAQVAWEKMTTYDRKRRSSFWLGFGPGEDDMPEVPKIDWLDVVWEAT